MAELNVDQVKERLLHQCEHLEERLQVYLQGGFQLFEVAKFVVEAAKVLVDASAKIADASPAAKRRAIREIIPAIYRKYDPDIPYVPEIVEPIVENILLDVVTRALADVLVPNQPAAPTT
jgi:hypothetical protein